MKNTATLKKSFVKKSVAMLMSAAVLFSFASTAFAFNDTADLSNDYKDAIGKLSALEVVNGYEDGSFKPEANITRAEFAKIASVLSGMKDGGDYLQSTPSKYKDVKVNEWYTGWINVANSKGLINGYPDGNFKPNQVISQQEVVTVLMRILGYNDNLAGPWPIDYINQATKLDVFDGIKFNGPAQANRGDVAMMGTSVLDKNLVNWDKDTEDFKEKGKDKTLLAENFKGNSVENQEVGTINLKNASKKQITVQIGTGENATNYTVDETTQFATGYTITNIKHHKADVIFTTENKDGSGVKTAKFIDITSEMKTADKVKVEKDGEDIKKVKLDDKSYPVVSGTKEADIATTGANVFYKAFLNEDGEVYKVIADSQDNEFKTGVVKEVKTNKDIALFGGKVDTKDNDVVIMKNGKNIELEDIKKYDVLTYTTDESVIFVEELKTGKLERVYDVVDAKHAVTIDGVKYPHVTNMYDNDDTSVTTWKDYVNTTVRYATTPQGTIQTIIAGDVENTSNLYGVVLNYSLSGGAYEGDVESVTVFNQDGKTVKYNVKDGEVFTKAQVQPGSFIKYRLNADGVIEKQLELKKQPHAGLKADVSDGRIALGGDKKIKYNIYDDVLAFNIDKDKEKVTVELVSAADLRKGDIATSTFTIEVKDKDGNQVNQAVTTNGIEYVLDGSRLDVLVLSQFNTDNNVKYGFVKDFGYDNGDFEKAVQFYGDSKEYELVVGSGVTMKDKGFYKYTIDGDQATVTDIGSVTTVEGTVNSVDNGLYSVVKEGVAGEDQFEITKDTIIVKIDAVKVGEKFEADTVKTGVEVNEDDNVYVIMNNIDEDKKGEALTVVIYEK